MAAVRKEERDVRGKVYIGLVTALALSAFVTTVRALGIPWGPDLFVFCILGVLLPLLQNVVDVGDRVRVDITSIVALAAQAIVGPVGAALTGAITGAMQGRRLKVEVRVFNSATFSLYCLFGGIAYRAAGGIAEPAALSDVSTVVIALALPMLIANIVQAATNLVLIAGVVRVQYGVPMRLQTASMLRGTGLAYAGFSIIAIPMVVLWEPAGLGPLAVVIVLAPLLVAQWAYRQYAEEQRGRQHALDVLVAAVEAKAPHLAGHSARVAELSARMAEHLGLGPQQVADTRVAGMLHDVGQTSLPTPLVRRLDLTDTTSSREYPARGAVILDGLDFLEGALEPITRHHEALAAARGLSLQARIVGVADTYDLLTRVGAPDGPLYAAQDARDVVAAAVGDTTLVRALDHALALGADAGSGR